MEPKERVKDFNKRFVTLLNKIPTTSQPIDVVLVEFYTVALSVTPTMFVKRVGKETLRENFDEAIKIAK